jgi:UPF0271 protein
MTGLPVIDLNADVGEGMSTDAELLGIVTSASISCGAHAGDEESIRGALRQAKSNYVRVGAHPGFPDRAHFGRVRLDLPVEDLQREIRRQLEWLDDIARQEENVLSFVKLHGAMANMAAESYEYALSAFRPVAEFDSELAILAIDRSAQLRAAQTLGLRVIREAYVDRAYQSDGLLVPRSSKGALITDLQTVVKQCFRVASGQIETIDGKLIASSARSICLHGDTPGAVQMARAIRNSLEAAGFKIRATG